MKMKRLMIVNNFSLRLFSVVEQVFRSKLARFVYHVSREPNCVSLLRALIGIVLG